MQEGDPPQAEAASGRAHGKSPADVARARFRLRLVLAFALVAAAVTFPLVEQIPTTTRTALSVVTLVAAVVVQVQALRERAQWRRHA